MGRILYPATVAGNIVDAHLRFQATKTTHMSNIHVPSALVESISATVILPTTQIVATSSTSIKRSYKYNYRDEHDSSGSSSSRNDGDNENNETTPTGSSILPVNPTTPPTTDPSNEFISTAGLGGGAKAGLIVGLTVGLILTALMLTLMGIRRKYGPDFRKWPMISSSSSRWGGKYDIGRIKDRFRRQGKGGNEQEFAVHHYKSESQGSWFVKEHFDYSEEDGTRRSMTTAPVRRLNEPSGPFPDLVETTGSKRSTVSQPTGKKRAASSQSIHDSSSVNSTRQYTTMILESEDLSSPESDILPLQTPDLHPLPALPSPPHPEAERQGKKKRIPGKSHFSWSTVNTSHNNTTTNTTSVPQTPGASSAVTIPSYYVSFYNQFISPPQSPSAQQNDETMSIRDSDLSRFKSIGSWVHYQSQRRLLQQQQQQQQRQKQKQIQKQKSFINAIEEYNATTSSPSSPSSPSIQPESNANGMGRQEKHSDKHRRSSTSSDSTLPVFRQHPGEEVDLGPSSRKGRVRSSILSRLMLGYSIS